MEKLKAQNEAFNNILKEAEKAIYSIKAPEDKLKSKEFLDRLHNDLEVVLNLHNDKLNIQAGYIAQREQNNKLYKKCKSLEEKALEEKGIQDED